MAEEQELPTSLAGGVQCDGVSREVPCSALKGETVPDSLPAQPLYHRLISFMISAYSAA